MAVLQPSDPNKKYIYTLKPDADVNDIYYTINLNATKQQNFEYDVDGTSRAEFDLNNYPIVEFTIDSGSTTSEVIDCGYWNNSATQIVGIQFPSEFTSASATFLSSDLYDGTYATVKNLGGSGDYSITIQSGSYVPLNTEIFSGLSYLKIVTNTQEAADSTLKASIITT